MSPPASSPRDSTSVNQTATWPATAASLSPMVKPVVKAVEVTVVEVSHGGLNRPSASAIRHAGTPGASYNAQARANSTVLSRAALPSPAAYSQQAALQLASDPPVCPAPAIAYRVPTSTPAVASYPTSGWAPAAQALTTWSSAIFLGPPRAAPPRATSDTSCKRLEDLGMTAGRWRPASASAPPAKNKKPRDSCPYVGARAPCPSSPNP